MGLEDDRKDLIDEEELRGMVRDKALSFRTKSEFARVLDVYPSFLHNYLGGTKGPGFKVLEHFGYEEVTMYRRKLPR